MLIVDAALRFSAKTVSVAVPGHEGCAGAAAPVKARTARTHQAPHMRIRVSKGHTPSGGVAAAFGTAPGQAVLLDVAPLQAGSVRWAACAPPQERTSSRMGPTGGAAPTTDTLDGRTRRRPALRPTASSTM